MRTISEAIQANKLKAIGKELTALARKSQSVKAIVDQLNAGKQPSKQEVQKLKGEIQDDVIIAFASVLGPTQTMKEYGVDVNEALQKGDTVTVKDRVKKWGKKKGTVTGTFGKELMVRLKGRSGEVSFFPDELVKEDIKQDYESLKKKSTTELKNIYKRSHRVSDTKGLSKDNLIFDILRAEYGDKKVDTFLNEDHINENNDPWIVIFNYGQGRQSVYPQTSSNKKPITVMTRAKAEAIAKKESEKEEKAVDKKPINKTSKVYVHAKPLDNNIWNYVTKRSPAGWAIKDLLDDMRESTKEQEMNTILEFAKVLPSDVKKAVDIAKKMGGNMTGAVEKIEQMKKGLSKHPSVKAALKTANESYDVFAELSELVRSKVIAESTGKLSGTKVAQVLSKNVKQTTKWGGNVNVSIMRTNTIIAYVMKGGKIQHSFNAKVTPNGWAVGNSPLFGAPADVTQGKKKFDDETAAKALQALFDVAKTVKEETEELDESKSDQVKLNQLYKDALGVVRYNKMKADLSSNVDSKTGELLVLDRGKVLARIPETKWKALLPNLPK